MERPVSVLIRKGLFIITKDVMLDEKVDNNFYKTKDSVNDLMINVKLKCVEDTQKIIFL